MPSAYSSPFSTPFSRFSHRVMHLVTPRRIKNRLGRGTDARAGSLASSLGEHRARLMHRSLTTRAKLRYRKRKTRVQSSKNWSLFFVFYATIWVIVPEYTSKALL